MINDYVLFETKIVPKEGTPYLPTFGKTKLVITINEIRVVDQKWTYTIPLHQIYSCTTKPMPIRTYIFPFGPTDAMHNFLIIDYLNEFNQRVLFRAVFTKYFWTKKNVVEAIRFDEVIKAYHLDDKFIKTPPSSDEKSND